MGDHGRARRQQTIHSSDDFMHLLYIFVPLPVWDPTCGILEFECGKPLKTLFYSKNKEAQGSPEMCLSDPAHKLSHRLRLRPACELLTVPSIYLARVDPSYSLRGATGNQALKHRQEGKRLLFCDLS